MKSEQPDIDVSNKAENQMTYKCSLENKIEEKSLEHLNFQGNSSYSVKNPEHFNNLKNQGSFSSNFINPFPLNNNNITNNQFNNIFKNFNNYSPMNKNLYSQQNMVNYHHNLVNQMNNYNYNHLPNFPGNNYNQFDLNNFQPQQESFNNSLGSNNNFPFSQNVQSFVVQINKLIEMFTQINAKNQSQSSTLLNNLSSLIIMIGTQESKDSDNNSINIISSSLEEAKKQIVSIIQYSNYQKLIIQTLTKQLDYVLEQLAYSYTGLKNNLINNNINQNYGFGGNLGNGVENVMNGYNDHPTLFRNTNDFENFKNY